MRENYIDWDSYFMGIALLSSMRSKDPNTQVGACIVNEDKRIVGVGYNGLPKGCEDTQFLLYHFELLPYCTRYKGIRLHI